MALKDIFPYYWSRAYPFILILGIAGLSYEIFCPRAYHVGIVDALSGFFIGLSLAGAIFRRARQ